MYKAFPGTYGDATIIKYDPFVASIASGAYDRYTYRLYDAAGDSYMERGCYLICDQGYGECRIMNSSSSRPNPSIVNMKLSKLSRDLRSEEG